MNKRPRVTLWTVGSCCRDNKNDVERLKEDISFLYKKEHKTTYRSV